MSESPPFCLAPWHSITLSANGSSGPCCIIPSGYTDSASEQSLFGSTGEAAKQFRLDMLDGKLSRKCNECLKKEKLGLNSVRMQYQERTKNWAQPKTHTYTKEIDPMDIVHLDLSPTNKCNFKCRYCYCGN